MANIAMSSQCLRILRHSCRTMRPQSPASTSRKFAAASTRRQQSPKAADPAPYTAPPPITTGTITANITAAPPDKVPIAEPEEASTSKPEEISATKSSQTVETSQTSQQPSSVTANVSTASMQKQILSSLEKPQDGLATKIAMRLNKNAKSTTESYTTYGVTEAFFKSCNAQADYTIPEDQRSRILVDKGPPKTAEGEDLGQIIDKNSWWFSELGLQPTFSTWSQVSYLHMYLLTVRLRAIDSSSEFLNYQRYLIEHFSNAAEDKMLILHGLGARGVRNKYLKDLFIQWRGLLTAYDEGIAKGDAVLAAAVWRNLWKGAEDVDWTKVAAVVLYMRRSLQYLNQSPTDLIALNLDDRGMLWKAAARDVMAASRKLSAGINENPAG